MSTNDRAKVRHKVKGEKGQTAKSCEFFLFLLDSESELDVDNYLTFFCMCI